MGTIAGYDSGCLFVVPERDAEHNLEYVRPYPPGDAILVMMDMVGIERLRV